MRGARRVALAAVSAIGEALVFASWIVERRAAAETNFVEVGCMIAIIGTVFNYGLSFALAFQRRTVKLVGIARRFLPAASLSGVIAILQSALIIAIAANEKTYSNTLVRVAILLTPVPILIVCDRLGIARREPD